MDSPRVDEKNNSYFYLASSEPGKKDEIHIYPARQSEYFLLITSDDLDNFVKTCAEFFGVIPVFSSIGVNNDNSVILIYTV